MQPRLLSREQLNPATYSADYSGLPPALKGRGGAVYLPVREQSRIPLGDVLLYEESDICVGHALGLSLTSRKQGEEECF